MKTKSIFFKISFIGVLFSFEYSHAQVTVYSELGFTGNSKVYTEGTHYLTDDVRSLKVTGDYAVVMAKSASCADECFYAKEHYGFLLYEERGGKRVGALLGRKGCTIKIKKINYNSAKIRVEVTTGADDLRQGSSAQVIVYKGRSTPVTVRMKEDNGFAPHSKKTFEVSISGVSLASLDRVAFSYFSGKQNPFDTGDNWDVKEFKVSYVCDSYMIPIVLFKKTNFRFTGHYKGDNVGIPGGIDNYSCTQ